MTLYFESRYAKGRIFILMLSLFVARVVILSVVCAGLDVFFCGFKLQRSGA